MPFVRRYVKFKLPAYASAISAAVNDLDLVVLGAVIQEEAVPQQVHLQNGFLSAAGLQGKVLFAHNIHAFFRLSSGYFRCCGGQLGAKALAVLYHTAGQQIDGIG